MAKLVKNLPLVGFLAIICSVFLAFPRIVFASQEVTFSLVILPTSAKNLGAVPIDRQGVIRADGNALAVISGFLGKKKFVTNGETNSANVNFFDFFGEALREVIVAAGNLYPLVKISQN